MRKISIGKSHEEGARFANDGKPAMTPTLPTLSVIVPIRAQLPAFYMERLALRDGYDLVGTEIILTDDGSPEETARELHAFCDTRGWRYMRLETAHRPFSLSRARNAGLAAAQAPWVLFDDADMTYETAFFRKLHRELALLDSTPFTFLSLPSVYLSDQSTREVIVRGGIDEILPELLTRMILEDPRGGTDNHAIQSFAPASAILVMRRETAISAGGYDEEFEGWGGEDRDFIFRLLAMNEKMPRPADFAATRVWNLNDTHEFTGWRSLYRLHGDYMARKGFYAFHLYHEPNAWKTPKAKEQNFELAARKALAIAETHDRPNGQTTPYNGLQRSLLFSIYTNCANTDMPRPRMAGMRRPAARFKKLYRNPHAFFRDSHLPFLRKIRHLFAEKKDVI